MTQARGKKSLVQLGDTGDMTRVEEQDKDVLSWPAGPGVYAAASPGSVGKRRRKLLFAEGKFGDRMAKSKSPGSIGRREVNPEADKEKENDSCCKRIPGPAGQSGLTPIFRNIKCHPCLTT